MTPDTTPGDLVGTVRAVQADLRERYDATEVDIDADETTTWEERHREGEANTKGRGTEHLSRQIEQTGRGEDLTITLRWFHPDIPTGDPERDPILQHLDHSIDVLEELTGDFPEAEVSTYANTDRAQVNLTWRADP